MSNSFAESFEMKEVLTSTGTRVRGTGVNVGIHAHFFGGFHEKHLCWNCEMEFYCNEDFFEHVSSMHSIDQSLVETQDPDLHCTNF